MNAGHVPVLLDEAIKYLRPKKGAVYVDTTLGSGGHAEKILETIRPDGRLIGIEIDPSILKIAKEKLKRFGDRCSFVESSFIELPSIIKELGFDAIDGILFDLGVNIEHFENASRGFGFSKDGPLDMRLSQKIKITAEKIVNDWEPGDLVRILYKFGEEKQAKKIVRLLVKEREKKRINSTKELAGLITKAVGNRGFSRIHPATKTFQALRIAVNDELNNIETTLPIAIDILKPGGRICVISFHSLEDRIVKNIFRSFSQSCICPKEVLQCVCGVAPKIKIITKKPILPSIEECRENIHSRSAKLRVAEKI